MAAITDGVATRPQPDAFLRSVAVRGVFLRRQPLVGIAVLAVCLLLVGHLREASPSVAATTRAMCGTERWTVKTLQDRPHLLPLRSVTLKYLVTRPAPASLPDRRLPFERHIFRVVATVTLIRPEADSDFHVVLRDDAGRTMITESPLGSCDLNAAPIYRREIARARAGTPALPARRRDRRRVLRL